MRVFAVQIDDDLFDAITERVKELGTTKRGYIESLTLKELRESQEAKQTAQSESDQENKENRNQPKMWDAKEVSEAIDSFIEKNNRIPTQKEFKNENGLPSYKAAGRALEISPAEYMKAKYDELAGKQVQESESLPEKEQEIDEDGGMLMGGM